MVFKRKENIILENNPINMVRTLLTILKVKYTQKTIQELKDNPYFPDLVSVSQTLSRLQVENIAVRSNYDELKRYPTPFVVHAYEGLFLIVKEVKENHIIFFETEEKEVSRSKDNFIKSWGGYALLVNATEKSKEKNYSFHLLKERFKKLRLLTIVSIVVLSLLIFFRQNFNWHTFLFKILSITGITTSIFLLIQLADKNNIFIKKICHSARNQNMNCSSILDSKSAYLFGLISWSEIGFIYFTSQSLVFLFLGKVGIHYLALISLFSAFFIFYSIFYQWKIAKTWCKLCLLIQATLLLQGTISISFFLKSDNLFFASQSTEILLLLLIPTVILTVTSYLLPLISELLINRKALKLSNNIKMDKSIFQSKLNQSYKIHTADISDKLLNYGSNESLDTLLLVINPACKPCIRTHKKLVEIISYNTTLQIQEIYLTDQIGSESYEVSLRMIEIYDGETIDYFKTAITDYYDNYTANPKKWLSKYKKQQYNTTKAAEILETQTNWLFNNNLTSTPKIIHNNRLLPEQYTIEDLEYLLY